VLFRRHIDWVRRCGRGLDECARPACMEAVSVEEVEACALASMAPLPR
jgi:hypothetical protein